jgi:CelD/BcsL family acetyltransferase involved in cellulose biosynthesis
MSGVREGGHGTVRAVVVRSVAELEPFRAGWDELAVASSSPYGAPAWMVGWWRNARPPRAVLRTIVVVRGDEVIGVAPLYATKARTGLTSYRILGSRCSSAVDLLARRGEEGVVASAITERLERSVPRVHTIAFDGVPAASPWPRLLSRGWPGSRAPAVYREVELGVPQLPLSGSFEAWLTGKSKNFRQNLRRQRRNLERLGGTIGRVDDAAELERALCALASLHHARWASRGGSRVLRPGVERMLIDAGRELLHQQRFDLWKIDVDGRCISAHLFLSAGTTTTYWLGGFDDAWGRYHPALLSLLAAVEHAFDRGMALIDLGTGTQDYKLRFSERVDHVRFVNVVPSRVATPLARLQLLPMKARRYAAERLPPEAKHAAKRIVGRIGHRRPP